MKKLWNKFFSPTPSHVKKWQKVSLGCGAVAVAITAGGAMYGFIPVIVVQVLAVIALAAPFLMQFSSEDSIVKDIKNDV